MDGNENLETKRVKKRNRQRKIFSVVGKEDVRF
jgi:hypothetical protein